MVIEGPCLLCEAPALSSEEPLDASVYGPDQFGHMVKCPDCGNFAIEATAFADLERTPDAPHRRLVLAYALLRIPKGQRRPYLDSRTIAAILAATRLPRQQEVPDAFVEYLGRIYPIPGQTALMNARRLRSAVGASTVEAAMWAFSAAYTEGFLDLGSVMAADGMGGRATLSVKGWRRFDELQHQRSESKQAFWASKYGVPELDKLVDDFLRPAVKATGFDLVRLDDLPRAGLIDDRLRVEIRRSRFLIADLTHANNGAYWEAGFAEGLGLPVIYTCRKAEWDSPETKPHFDTNHFTTVIWDETVAQTAAEQLKVVIRATLPAEAALTDQ